MTEPVCGSDHCITCGDDGVPMTVVIVEADGLALCVAADGTESLVETALVDALARGDAVLVHAGVAIALIPPVEVLA